MRKNILLVTAIWLILITFSFYYNRISQEKNRADIAFQTAESFFNQLVFSRCWNANHGGVYVPVTQTTKPNPYLKIPRREIIVDDKLTLTMINPAFMTRQIAELAQNARGTQFHITSLKPIRPQNAPTVQERKALLIFKQGTKPIGYFTGKNNGLEYFFMAPLLVKKKCLKCHSEQGYKEGEIRGGISVILPAIPHAPWLPLLGAHLGFAVIGGLAIFYIGSRLNRAYKLIQHQAIIDALTGIPNRRCFSENILKEYKRCQRNHKPLSVIICDIDNFKAYNDLYGHSQGDICLQMVAKAIDDSLLRPGDFCARYGGEEFVIILPDTRSKGAQMVAERIRKKIVHLNIEHKRSLPLGLVSISLGVATAHTQETLEHEDLIKFADMALYKAKDMGRNRVEVFGIGNFSAA